MFTLEDLQDQVELQGNIKVLKYIDKQERYEEIPFKKALSKEITYMYAKDNCLIIEIAGEEQ